MTPEEDTDDKYKWTLRQNPLPCHFKELQNDGFSFTKIHYIQGVPTPLYYFRVPKVAPPAEEEDDVFDHIGDLNFSAQLQRELRHATRIQRQQRERMGVVQQQRRRAEYIA